MRGEGEGDEQDAVNLACVSREAFQAPSGRHPIYKAVPGLGPDPPAAPRPVLDTVTFCGAVSYRDHPTPVRRIYPK